MSRIMRDVVTPANVSNGFVVELPTGDVRAVTDAEYDRHMGEWSFLGEDNSGARKFYSLIEPAYHVRYFGEYESATA